ncbi:LacI family DNA-binding transcriptional regulator [Streptomyces endophyticus]|uniref:LacI family transcriptional regulator n=1 Tax=Streptomyces endophyticus TaxID=714166 RepID=A0ABU6F178_9ACTN|nr:LacI family DNA-binding transcriptional regulator [Streptomyces endophyticus]MEB8337747.1 LacI family transcriptional regulator [Streptomyces endophyticus]
MARTQGITIKDVARRAGVSITAVSHALNGKGTLSAATREHIREVADEMGYAADALARGMRSSTMGAVGLVLRSLDALGDYKPEGVDVFEKFVGAAASQALARGLSLMLVPDLTRAPVPPLTFSMDGYIITNPHRDDPVVALLDKRGIPYVTYGRAPGRPDFPYWASEDDAASARLVLDHLAARGARSIALVRGTDANAWNDEHEEAYAAWCAARNMPARLYELAERAGVGGGVDLARRITADGLPDAVFCLTGRHAAGVQEGLIAQGIAVPDQVMVVAGSDSEHSRGARPTISALELDPVGSSGALLDILQALIAGTEPAAPRITQAHLRERESTRRRPG